MGFTLRDETFFEQPFVKLFKNAIFDASLTDRIFDLPESPEIKQVGNDYTILLNSRPSATRLIKVDASRIAKDDVISGLAILYGYGFARHNYNLPLFSGARLGRDADFAKKLATEIWDERVHIYWMRNHRGHAGHNESKDLEFCILVAEDNKDEAIRRHRQATDNFKDTPHNPTLNNFVVYMTANANMLLQIFDDQASITGRHYNQTSYKKEHNVFQDDFLKKGVLIEDFTGKYLWLPS